MAKKVAAAPLQEKDDDRQVCQKCGKNLKLGSFYKYRDGTYCELCKNCLTLHMDAFEESTYTWILKKFDVPYVPEEWRSIVTAAFKKNPNKFSHTSVLGNYLGKMKLNQWNKYHWADSEALQKRDEIAREEEKKVREENKERFKKLYEMGEISEAEYQTMMDTSDLYNDMKGDRASGANLYQKVKEERANAAAEAAQSPNEDEGVDEPKVDLTDEDKEYLSLKWGNNYSPYEWVCLEKKYNEMIDSFAIEDSDSISTLILICKTELQVNQALDSRDYESYRSLTGVYNSLRKSSNFTAAQKKQEDKDKFKSVGKIVEWCEKQGGKIPRWDLSVPVDIIDVLITDIKEYTRNLFAQDPTMADALNTYIVRKEALEMEGKKEEVSQYKETMGAEERYKELTDSYLNKTSKPATPNYSLDFEDDTAEVWGEIDDSDMNVDIDEDTEIEDES
jgi:hypothetical protein